MIRIFLFNYIFWLINVKLIYLGNVKGKQDEKGSTIPSLYGLDSFDPNITFALCCGTRSSPAVSFLLETMNSFKTKKVVYDNIFGFFTKYQTIRTSFFLTLSRSSSFLIIKADTQEYSLLIVPLNSDGGYSSSQQH